MVAAGEQGSFARRKAFSPLNCEEPMLDGSGHSDLESGLT